MVSSLRRVDCLLQFLVSLSCLLFTSADYVCICSRAVDSPLHIAPDQTSHIIGYLYQFDCKPKYTGSLGLVGSWNAVFINHQIAYIQMTPSVLTETCHGDLPAEDKLSTAPIVPPSTTIRRSTTSSSTARTSSPSTFSSTSGTTTRSTTYATVAKECPSNVRNAARSNHGNTTVYGNNCYEFVPYRYSWQYAENNCKNKGGHLVHIRDMAEENNILQFLSDNNYEHHIWIGLSDSDSELNFQWSSGDPVTFTKWKPGYDSHHTLHHIKDCVLLAPTFNRYSIYGEWDDTTCISEHPWVCQYDAVPAKPTTTQSTTSSSSNYNHYHHHGSSNNNYNNNYYNNQNQSTYNQNSHGHSGSNYNEHESYYNTYTTTKPIDERIKDYFLDLIG